MATAIEYGLIAGNLALTIQFVDGERSALGLATIPTGSSGATAGNDTFLGSSLSESFVGLGGNDTITTGGGNDLLWGDSSTGFGDQGSDTFVITPDAGTVVAIADFCTETGFGRLDKIDLSAFNLSFSDLNITQTTGSFLVNGSTFNYIRSDIDLGNGQELRILQHITNLTPSPTLTAADFLGLQPEPVNNDPMAVGTLPSQLIDDNTPTVVLTAAEIAAAFTDADAGDVLTYSLGAGSPPWLSFDVDGNLVSNGVITIGTYVVSLQASDGHGGMDATQTFNIAVNNLNTDPVAAADMVNVSEDTAAVLNVLANDTDADMNALTITAINTSGTVGSVAIAADNLSVTYDPNHQFESLGVGQTATDTFTYTISDGQGGTDTETVTVTVQGANDDPTAVGTLANQAVDENATTTVLTAAQIAAAFADVDANDTLTFSLAAGSPSWLSLDMDGNLVSTNPAQADVGAHTVTLEASDGHGGTNAMQSFNLTVNDMNDMPLANDDVVQVDLGQSLLIDVRANDTDAEDGIPSGVITITASPAHGTVSVVDGKVLYTADHDFTGITHFSYTVKDSAGNVSNVGMVAVGVEAPEGAIIGTSGNDAILGRLLHGDNIYSLAGDDVVLSGIFGNDFVSGGSGNDDLLGGLGNDIIEGNEGNDWIRGGAGNDHLYGNEGNDKLFGSLGNDVLNGGLGADELSGGIGADIFVIGKNEGVDRIKDWDTGCGNDKIDLSGHGLSFSALSIVKSGGQTTVSSASEGTIVILDGKQTLHADDFIF